MAQTCSGLGAFIGFPNALPLHRVFLWEHLLGKQAMPEDVLIAETSPQHSRVEGAEEFPREAGERQVPDHRWQPRALLFPVLFIQAMLCSA